MSATKSVKPAMAIAYAAFQGLALGTISNMYNTMYDGIVSQAILVTLSAFTGMLFALNLLWSFNYSRLAFSKVLFPNVISFSKLKYSILFIARSADYLSRLK